MPEEVVYVGETREVSIRTKIFKTLHEEFNPAMYSFGCPIGQNPCGQLEEISNEYSDRNVFIAIPYSRYSYENDIREVLQAAGLNPKAAKDKITSKMLLCKVCEELRKCAYGVVDISKNNLNVVYELGLMQSLGKECAILLKSGASRQTDLQGIENVLYQDARRLKTKLAKWIEDNIRNFNENELRSYIGNL